jgi:ribosomal protein S18 acetylase RimI-like enzyme
VGQALEIRRAGVADAAVIAALTGAAYAKWTPILGREAKPMTVDYEEAVRKNRFDLLIVEGEAVALIETIAEPDGLLIENVAVSPSFQRRGFGRRMLAHAEDIAAAAGYGKIRLYTNQRFAANVTLYLKLGYRIDSEEPFLGGAQVNMSKALTGLPPADVARA